MKKLCLLLLLLCCCGLQAQNHFPNIPDYKKYKALKGKPLSDKFSNIESVKVVYDLRRKKMYYFNSSKIRLHYEFVMQELGYVYDLHTFNADNYSNTEKGRDFLLGNLNHIKGTDKWIFELAASDHMPVTLIERFYKLVTETTFIGKKLNFYLNTREKIGQYNNRQFHIPCVTSEYIFNEVSYQEVVHGEAVGILKSYTLQELDSVRPKSDEIIIVEGTPEILPDVRGIIVSELQTPLSHLVILGKNRKIPVMAYTKVGKDAAIRNLLGKKVALRIKVDTFYVSVTEKPIAVRTALKKKKLLLDTITNDIVDLATVHPGGVNYIGAKAQNMSYLVAVSKQKPMFRVPEYAHAIPFYYYTKHVGTPKIKLLIAELLRHTAKDDATWINTQLKRIRKAIKEQPLDSVLLSKIDAVTGKQDRFKNFRFRSSTNAEDIDGFNGAGLYDSKTGIVGDEKKSFEKAIKDVWASVWNEAPYWEREHFGIDQKAIAMGVLFHRSFPDELANGVIITKNISRKGFSGITVNVQKGENSVVKPEKGEICEQFTVYQFNSEKPDLEVDYSSQSNLNDNKPLLSTEEINRLYLAATMLQSKLRRYWKKPNAVADIEFKIVGEQRELYVKQIRVFND